MADDTPTVESLRDKLLAAIAVTIHKRSEIDTIAPAVDALIAAVRAEYDRKDREHPLIAQYEREMDRLNACIAALAEDANPDFS